MNRRDFLRLGASAIKKQVVEAPKALAKIPKSTMTNVKQYDKLARDIKSKGNLLTPRRSFLDKAKKRAAVMLIKNPKETTYRVKQGARNIGNAIKTPLTPLDDLVMKSEGRKIKGIGKILGIFSKLYNLREF